ncbi:MAG: SDR family oxidoreductase [Actinomycetota bacterium]|nr:SDR family oxidoreductase [Actinomycetota bacterium]MDQ6948109.1 SDR family oxidoreductase [Actinomycetota bacterium]
MGAVKAVISATHLGVPANSDVSFPGVPAVNRAGRTEHFEVLYERTLGETGRFAGAAVLNRAEWDLATIREWFGALRLPSEDFTVVLARTADYVGASRDVGEAGGTTTVFCDVQTVPAVEPLQSSFFLAVVLSDLFAAAAGWDPAPAGALARTLATALYPRRIIGFTTAWVWLESDRDDFAAEPLPSPPPAAATGCAVLFLNYLHHQLGFSWREIAALAAPTLGALAARLTGSEGEPDRFRSLLAEHFRAGEPSQQQTDNVFPLPDEATRPAPRPSPLGTSDRVRADERRVCLLTGSSGTLGNYLCEHHGDRYEFAAVYRRNRPRGGVYSVEADLSVDGEPERVVALTLARFGRLDLVINAAVASIWGPMLDAEQLESSAPAQFLTNVVVPLRVAGAAARLFWRDRVEENRASNRNVVNVSSVSGQNIYAGEGQSVYAASKAALDHLTGHMALEFAAIGVRVNAIAPNSFPSNVSIDRAAQAITGLDDGDNTGAIVVVDGPADRLIQLTQAPAASG